MATPPPDVAEAAKRVDDWLKSVGRKASDAEFGAMSAAERLDYCRRFPQARDTGKRS